MLAIDQLPDDPTLLKDMLVEHYARRDAEIQAAVEAEIQTAVDEAVQAAVNEAGGEDDAGSNGLFPAADVRPAQ